MFSIKIGEETFLDFYSFMRTFKKELNEYKLNIVEEAFSKIDTKGDDKVNLNVVKMKYNPSKHPDVLNGKYSEDEKIMEMEQLVLKYNPHWKGGGFKQYQYSFPEWAENRFDIATIHSYNTVLTFTKEQWLGRIKSCRGVGASLSPEMIQAFENEYKNILAKYDEPLKLLHQIHIEIYFARQKNG